MIQRQPEYQAGLLDCTHPLETAKVSAWMFPSTIPLKRQLRLTNMVVPSVVASLSPAVGDKWGLRAQEFCPAIGRISDKLSIEGRKS